MKDKVAKISIAGTILCLVALSPVYASHFQFEKSENTVKEGKPIPTTWEESETKEVVDMLYASWHRGIDRLAAQEAASFNKNDFTLYFGFDIQKQYTHRLSNTEHQSFHMTVNEAKKSYEKGDKAYGILLSSDERNAIIIWERNTGITHVAKMEKYVGDVRGPLWKLVNEFDLPE